MKIILNETDDDPVVTPVAGVTETVIVEGAANYAPAGPAGPQGEDGPQGDKGDMGFQMLNSVPAVSRWFTSPFVRGEQLREPLAWPSHQRSLPIPVTAPIYIDGLAIRITAAATAGSGNILAVKVYSDDGSGHPSTNVLASATFGLESVGVINSILSNQVLIEPPYVWAGIDFVDSVVTAGTPCRIRFVETSGMGSAIHDNSSAVLNPSPFNVPDNTNNGLFFWRPSIALRRSA